MVAAGCCTGVIVKFFLEWRVSFCYSRVIFIQRRGALALVEGCMPL